MSEGRGSYPRVYLYRRGKRSEEGHSGGGRLNHTHYQISELVALIMRKGANLHSTVCCYIRPPPTAAAGAGPNLTLTALTTGATAVESTDVVHSPGELLTTASSSKSPPLLLPIPRNAVGDDPIEKLCSGLLLPLYDVLADGPK